MLQSEALNILKAGRNVYLTGAAGTGKTYVLNQYIAYLKERGVGVAVTAPTGIAATHIGGMTIHSWSGMGIKDELSEYDVESLVQKERLWKRFDTTKVLIIDEISMMSPRMFDSLNRLAKAMKGDERAFGGMQVILSGDFFQLPPITRDNERIAYIDSSRAWREMDVRVCYLEEQYRQNDHSLQSILDEIRSGEVSDATIEILQGLVEGETDTSRKPTRLYTHNVDVDVVNERELKKLSGNTQEYQMVAQGKSHLVANICKSILAPETLCLKKDAVVMFVKNNFEAGYVNGTLGRVVDFEDDMPVVRTHDGKKIYVSQDTWEIEDEGKVLASVAQLPLRLAWAITVHKSQGMTLDAAVMDLSKSFVPGQGYVALSRVRDLEGLGLLGISNMALMVDPYVLELNRWLKKESDKWTKVITKFDDTDFATMHDEFIVICGGTNDPKKIKENREKEKEGFVPKVPTHEKTLALLREGKSLKEAASERGMTMGTIITHLEKIKDGTYDIDLEPYMPDQKDMKAIKKAFDESKDGKLSPVHKKLKGKYTFDTLRLARMFLDEV